MPRLLIAFALLALGAAAAPVRAGDVLRIATSAMPLSKALPYAPVAQPQAIFVQMVYDGLTRVGPGGTALPGLAVSWTRETPTRWVFALRPGVQFSNGEPFTAAAVVAALAYLSTPEGVRDSIAHEDLSKSMAAFRARDDLTVEIETRQPDPILPLHLNFVRVPAPGAWRVGGRAAFQTHPVGTGPFTVTEWSDARVMLAANPTSWRKPQVDGLAVRIVNDPVARLQAFTSHALDIALDINPEDQAAVAAVGGRIAARHQPNVLYMQFVTVKPSPLQDPRVRRALNFAVNKTALIDTFLNGATAPASQFSHPGAFGFDPALQAYAYDPARAKALLAEAGYGSGFGITVLIDATGGGNYATWFQEIAQNLAAVGVTMTVQASTTARMAESVISGAWPAEAFGWSFAGFDSLNGYRFRSCLKDHPYTCDAALTPLIAAAQAAPSEDARQAATRAALKTEAASPPGILLWQAVRFDAVAAGVTGFAAVNDAFAWDSVSRAR